MSTDTLEAANSTTPGRRTSLGGRKLLPILLLGVSALVVGSGCGPKAGPPPEEGVSTPTATDAIGTRPLRLAVVPGTVFTYRFEQDEEQKEYRVPGGEQNPGTIKMTIRATMVRTCVAADDGTFEFVDKFENVEVDVVCGGRHEGKEDVIRSVRERELAKVGKSKFDDRFRQVTEDGRTASSAGVQAYFPEGILKPGDIWGGEVPDIQNPDDPAYQLQGMMPKLTFRYAGIDRIGEWDAIKIDTESDGSEAMGLDGPASSWFDVETGMLVRFTANIRASAPTSMNVRILMDLQGVR